jgi:hypothetical protein
VIAHRWMGRKRDCSSETCTASHSRPVMVRRLPLSTSVSPTWSVISFDGRWRRVGSHWQSLPFGVWTADGRDKRDNAPPRSTKATNADAGCRWVYAGCPLQPTLSKWAILGTYVGWQRRQLSGLLRWPAPPCILSWQEHAGQRQLRRWRRERSRTEKKPTVNKTICGTKILILWVWIIRNSWRWPHLFLLIF